MQIQSRGAFDIPSFCAWASIGRSTAYEEARAGRLRLTKVGRKSIIVAADAQACLESLPKCAGGAAEWLPLRQSRATRLVTFPFHDRITWAIQTRTQDLSRSSLTTGPIDSGRPNT